MSTLGVVQGYLADKEPPPPRTTAGPTCRPSAECGEGAAPRERGSLVGLVLERYDHPRGGTHPEFRGVYVQGFVANKDTDGPMLLRLAIP